MACFAAELFVRSRGKMHTKSKRETCDQAYAGQHRSCDRDRTSFIVLAGLKVRTADKALRDCSAKQPQDAKLHFTTQREVHLHAVACANTADHGHPCVFANSEATNEAMLFNQDSS